jgi:hypothetical protein
MATGQKGFTARGLGIHYDMHAGRLQTLLPNRDFSSEKEYEENAVRFMWGECTENMRQCRNSRGDVVRFDTITEEFGIRSSDGYVRTYYIPNPLEHQRTSNASYFVSNCVKYEKCH